MIYYDKQNEKHPYEKKMYIYISIIVNHNITHLFISHMINTVSKDVLCTALIFVLSVLRYYSNSYAGFIIAKCLFVTHKEMHRSILSVYVIKE